VSYDVERRIIWHDEDMVGGAAKAPKKTASQPTTRRLVNMFVSEREQRLARHDVESLGERKLSPELSASMIAKGFHYYAQQYPELMEYFLDIIQCVCQFYLTK
jgi:hypothetical protein